MTSKNTKGNLFHPFDYFKNVTKIRHRLYLITNVVTEVASLEISRKSTKIKEQFF